jgi:hypothetical protein
MNPAAVLVILVLMFVYYVDYSKETSYEDEHVSACDMWAHNPECKDPAYLKAQEEIVNPGIHTKMDFGQGWGESTKDL